jgi:hypothetical protein
VIRIARSTAFCTALAIVFVAQFALETAKPSLATFSSITANAGNAMSAANSFYRAVVLADTPVAYWRLGESSGTTATDQMGTSPGGYGGAVTIGVQGGLANDSDLAIDTFGGGMGVTDTAALRPATNVTVEAWVRPDTNPATQFIVNKGLDYFLYIEGGAMKFGVRTNPPLTYWAVASSTFTAGAWQHVVGTYNGSQLRLYRNGTEVGVSAASGALTTVGGNLIVGAFDSNGSTWYDGRVDEVAVYSGALTAAQVLNHYQRGALTQ